MTLDRHAALQSASWGLGQVMGFNAERVGFGSVEEMVARMVGSENAQVGAMARFIVACDLHGALRSHDWARFAHGYNGPNYRINSYDTRLAAAYAQSDRGGLPDLVVRAAQVFLTYLGYDPRGVDGIMGRMTRAAMNEFQWKTHLPATDYVDERTFAALKFAMSSP